MMIWNEDVPGIGGSWKGYTMRALYLQGVYSAVQKDVMQKESEDVFWSEEARGSVNRL